MGAGALIGDMVKSGVKRFLHIAPGRPFFPWDQLDFILGATLFVLPIMTIPLEVFFTALLLTPPLHLLVNVIAYWWGLKEVWW